LFVFNTTTYAARIQVEVSGTLSYAHGNDASGNATTSDIVKVGDAFSYRLIFNETNSPEYGTIDLNAITGFSGHAGGFSFSGQSGQAYTLRQDDPPNGNNFITVHGTNAFNDNPGNRNDFTQVSDPVGGVQLNLISFNSVTGVDRVYNLALTQDKLPSAIPPGSGHLFIQFSKPSGQQINEQFQLIGALDTITVTNLDNVSAVPVPAAVWLFGSGLLSLFGFSQRSATTKKLSWVRSLRITPILRSAMLTDLPR
jgi:hypothetical protein